MNSDENKEVKTIWLLYHGTNNGAPEDYSVLYAKPEVFDDEQVAKDREQEILKILSLSKSDNYVFLVDFDLNRKISTEQLKKDYGIK